MTENQPIFRPLYHFLPPTSWSNDPNGLIEWHGQYHAFYQANPDAPDFGQMVWGHAVSSDLVHWNHLPVALRPDSAEDRDGCWTGCAVDHDGLPTLIYTGRASEKENVCLAISHDSLLTFEKLPRPLEVPQPPGESLAGFRDPYVWRETDGWYMVIGSGFAGRGGAALLYHSPDLRRWEYLGPLLAADSDSTGSMWECPNFFPLGDKHVLIVSASPLEYVHYFVGQYVDHRLIVEHEGLVDFGRHFYAPQVFLDSRGRAIIFGWLWEELTKEARLNQGWAGMFSLPRVLSIGPDGSLVNTPAPELSLLQRAEITQEDFDIIPGTDDPLPVQGDCFELLIEFVPGQAACGVRLTCSADGREETLVGYDPVTQQVFIDTAQASLLPGALGGKMVGKLSLKPVEALSLHIYFDHSVVEVFANDRISLSTRIYPTQDHTGGNCLFSSGAVTHIKHIKTWVLDSIW